MEERLGWCATGRGALLKVQEMDFIQRLLCTTFCGRRLTTMLCEAFLSKSAECVQIFLYSKKIWTEEGAKRATKRCIGGLYEVFFKKVSFFNSERMKIKIKNTNRICAVKFSCTFKKFIKVITFQCIFRNIN
jgi:hypothetical protein